MKAITKDEYEKSRMKGRELLGRGTNATTDGVSNRTEDLAIGWEYEKQPSGGCFLRSLLMDVVLADRPRCAHPPPQPTLTAPLDSPHCKLGVNNERFLLGDLGRTSAGPGRTHSDVLIWRDEDLRSKSSSGPIRLGEARRSPAKPILYLRRSHNANKSDEVYSREYQNQNNLLQTNTVMSNRPNLVAVTLLRCDFTTL